MPTLRISVLSVLSVRWPNGRALHGYTEANGADSSRRTLGKDIWLSQCRRNILVNGVDILFVVPCYENRR